MKELDINRPGKTQGEKVDAAIGKMAFCLSKEAEQPAASEYKSSSYIFDMLYHLGTSIDPVKYHAAQGFDAFKDELLEMLNEDFQMREEAKRKMEQDK